MRRLLNGFAVLVAATLLSGCGGCGGGSAEVPVEEKSDQPTVTGVGGTAEISLEKLLATPRAELAAQADEVATRVQLQEKARREGKQFPLLPDLRLPLAVPVFREAKFNAALGFSVPPYLAEGKKDSVLALHL